MKHSTSLPAPGLGRAAHIPLGLFLAVAILTLAVLPASAKVIGWWPGLVAEPGQGYDPASPNPKPPVATVSGTPTIVSSGNGGTSLSIKVVHHNSDLYEATSLSTVAGVHTLAYDAEVGFSLVDRFQSSANTLTFAIRYSRGYDDHLFRPTGLDPSFLAFVERARQDYSGEALHREITSRYGSYYIKGYRQRAEVLVLYTFTFRSSSVVRDFHLDWDFQGGGAGWDANWQGQFESWLNSSETTRSLSYEFHSTDGADINTLGIPRAGTITSIEEFHAFATNVLDYCEQMTPANAQTREWILDPIMNLPGYQLLVYPYNPAAPLDSSYERFLDTYSKLKKWEGLLRDWRTTPGAMSWLNSNGVRLVANTHLDLLNAVKGMEARARRHFETKERLDVTEDLMNHFANIGRIPRPTINVIQAIHDGGVRYLIGYVNCGRLELTGEHPFLKYVQLLDGAETGAAGFIYDSQNAMASLFTQNYDANPTLVNFTQNLTNSVPWATLRDAATRCRLGFFYTSAPVSEASRWSTAVKDAAGNIVEAANFLTSNSDLGAAFTPTEDESDVGTVAIRAPSQGAIDSVCRYDYAITNLSLNPTYGNIATLLIPAGMEVLAMRGSQGFGTVTNGQVRYEVGPLAYGSAVTIQLDLVPTRTGVLSAATPATVTVGEGLIDPNPANNSVMPAPITVTPPLLSLAKTAGGVELSWVSETGRTTLQSALGLSGTLQWRSVTNAPAVVGSTRTVRLPATGASKFFRLRFS